MKIKIFKILKLMIFFSISISLSLNCGKTQKIIDNKSDDNDDNMEYYSYLADSTGMLQTVFTVKQDVFFHFGMINRGTMPQEFTKVHGGPPIVLFSVFKNDSLVGTSDDGYYYPAVMLPGELAPGDTLQYFTSWYSNDYHDSLTVGTYFTKIIPYFYLEDIAPSVCLDSIHFEIILE